MIKTQLIAVSVIDKVLSGSSLTGELNACWRKHSTLSHQQKGAIQDFCYGVLRFYGQLTAIQTALLKKPLQDKKISYLLLVGLYQLLYCKLSAYTVVNQAVSASRALAAGTKMQGLINAVLRNFIRRKNQLLTKAAEKDTGIYSHPQWWINKLRAQYPQHYHTILTTNNAHPPMTLRVNQRKVSVAAYQQTLLDNGMESEHIWHDALLLNKPVGVEKLPGFNDGLASVQDAGAQLAAPFLDVHKNMRVLDACAAPGGKSAHLLELADISLTILDNDRDRLTRVEQNLERLEIKAERIVCGDAANPDLWWNNKPYDRILADVPCSASGVVRRHPDIKWLRRESDLEQLVTHQQAILGALWQILARNGKLLYVTCSVFMEENKLLIDLFLQQHSDALIEPLSMMELQNGQLLPGPHHDGFFYALLHKQ